VKPADEQRLWRLVGDGVSGGGITTVPVFRLACERVLDTGEVSHSEVYQGIRGTVVDKPDRARVLYPEAVDPMAEFVRDCLDQLVSRKFLAPLGDDQFGPGVGFEAMPGRSVIVVPIRRGKHKATRVIIYPKAEREALDRQTRWDGTVNGLIADFRPVVRDEHFRELKASLELRGWNPRYPAVADRQGRIVVGRHRLAAAEELGIEPVVQTVSVDAADLLDEAIYSNLGKPLSKSERDRIMLHLHLEGWSQREIANRLGVGYQVVRTALNNAEPKSSDQGEQVEPPSKPSPKRSYPRRLTHQQEEEILAMVEAGTGTRGAVVERFGVGDSVAQHAITRAKVRIEERGLAAAAAVEAEAVRVATLEAARADRFERAMAVMRPFWGTEGGLAEAVTALMEAGLL
jgi:transposase